MLKSSSFRGILAAFLCYFIWGFTFIFSRLALDTAIPSVVLAVRFTLAFIVMNLLWLTKAIKISFRGKKFMRLIPLGLLEPVIYFIFEQYGIIFTNSSFSGVMISLIPIVSLMLSAVFLHEKPSVGQIMFSILSIVGIIVLTLQDSTGGAIRPIGVIFLLVAILSGSGFTIVSRSTADQFNYFERTYVMIGMGSVFFIGMALVQHSFDLSVFVLPFAYPKFTLSVLFLGLFASVCSYLLINYSVSIIPVAQAAVFANITTIVSVIAGVAFMHDNFTWLSAVCSAVIVIGVWGVQKTAPPTADDN